jgi:hypothetical protein
MKNPFKHFEETIEKDNELREILKHGEASVLCAIGGLRVKVYMVQMSEEPGHAPYGALVGINIKRLSSADKVRVMEILDELQFLESAQK